MVDQTHPVTKQRLGELNGNDQTQAQQRPVIHCAASGRNLTVEIGRLRLNAERHVDGVERPDAGVLRPVDLIGSSGHPEFWPVKG